MYISEMRLEMLRKNFNFHWLATNHLTHLFINSSTVP